MLAQRDPGATSIPDRHRSGPHAADSPPATVIASWLEDRRLALR